MFKCTKHFEECNLKIDINDISNQIYLAKLNPMRMVAAQTHCDVCLNLIKQPNSEKVSLILKSV